MPQFTSNQQKAFDITGHRAVIANAGSGKTTVLVHRYVNIVQFGHASVNEVVALTFTDKAAAEMRHRIAETVNERINSVTRPAEHQRLEELREQLSSAIIGTIHSFCSRLLREYPVDVPVDEWGGVDPSFTIIDGIDRQELLNEASRDVLQKVLLKSSLKEEFSSVVRMLGRPAALKIIASLIYNRELVNRLILAPGIEKGGIYSSSDADIISQWKEKIQNHIQILLSDPQIEDAFQTIYRHAKSEQKQSGFSKLDNFRQENSPLILSEIFFDLFEDIFTEKNELRVRGFPKGIDSKQFRSEIDFLAKTEKYLHPFREGWNTIDESHQRLVQTSRTLLRVYSLIESEYNRRKMDTSALDFEDLQLFARALLQKPELSDRIAQRWKFIMVDEYQDTNRLQYDILCSLLRNVAGGNLFIVGDPKQSIYRFRHAEVELFQQTIDEIVLRRESPECGSSITLAESFRMLPNLAGFINSVFASCMKKEINPFSISYDPIVVARDSKADGRVEFLLAEDLRNTESDGEGEEADNRGAVDTLSSTQYGEEEKMIVRRILSLYESGFPIHDQKSDQPHPFRFIDCAILLRSRSSLPQLEQALIDQHVPYVVSSGVGFFQTQELYDVFNYLQFILNPHDDTSLCGILRSPFFSCSDAALFKVSLVDGEGDFWSRARTFVERDEQEDPTLTRAVRILESDIRRAGREQLSSMILRILARTGYNGISVASPRSEQNKANIGKLLELAHTFEAKGFGTIYDFVERLRVLIAEEEKEGQAAIEESEDAVRIMTIHAAKGLEFNVVFIPYLHKKFRYDSSPYLDHQLGIGFSLPSPDNFDKTEVPLFTKYLDQRSRLHTEAEEQRIFYVGCTRAKDVLILSATSGIRKSKSTSWLQWLERVWPVSDSSNDVLLHRERLTLLKRNTDGDQLEEREIEIPLFRFVGPESISLVKEYDDRFQKHQEISTVALEIMPGQEHGEFFSATQIKTFHDCPFRYYLRSRLGMPEPQMFFDEDNDDDEVHEPLSATKYGSLVHRILQGIVGHPTDEELQQRILSVLSEEGIHDEIQTLDLLDRCTTDISKFCNSSLGKRIFTASIVRTEFTLSALIDREFVMGTIDRLVRIDDRWEILDYKTDSAAYADLSKKFSEYYFQMITYAYLVHRWTGQKTIPVTLVFLQEPQEPIQIFVSEEQFGDFEAKVRFMIGEIRGENFRKERTHCPRCPYFVAGDCIHHDANNSKINQNPL